MSDQPSLRLDAPREEVLAHAAELIAEAWRGFDQARPGQPEVDARCARCCARRCRRAPTPAEEVLEDAARILDETIAQPRPRYFAFVGSSGLEIGVIGDALASCFDANLAVYAGAASDIEEQAVRWVGELVGYPGGGGAFTSGGTISQPDRAGGRPRAGAARRAPRRTGWPPGGGVLLGRGPLLGRARGRAAGHGRRGRAASCSIDDHRRMRPDLLAEAIDRRPSPMASRRSRWSRPRARR